MGLVLLLVGYLILFGSLNIEPWSMEWVLSTVAMCLAYWGGTLVNKK